LQFSERRSDHVPERRQNHGARTSNKATSRENHHRDHNRTPRCLNTPLTPLPQRGDPRLEPADRVANLTLQPAEKVLLVILLVVDHCIDHTRDLVVVPTNVLNKLVVRQLYHRSIETAKSLFRWDTTSTERPVVIRYMCVIRGCRT
jgi:hypothetical protein